MAVNRVLIGVLLLGFVLVEDSSAFASKKKQAPGRGKSSRARMVKKPDAKTIQKRAENDYLRHEHEMRYRQFQQMQQAQQRGMQRNIQAQQNSETGNR